MSSIRNDDRIIRPAFTRKGYEEQVKPYFEGGMEDLLDPAWVLAPGNEEADELEAEEVAAIKSEYFKQYVQEWRVFVDHPAGSFDPFAGLSHAWKRTPHLRLLGVEFLGPGVVLARVDR